MSPSEATGGQVYGLPETEEASVTTYLIFILLRSHSPEAILCGRIEVH